MGKQREAYHLETRSVRGDLKVQIAPHPDTYPFFTKHAMAKGKQTGRYISLMLDVLASDPSLWQQVVERL